MQTGSSVPLRPVRGSAFHGFPDRKPDDSPPCPSSHQSISAGSATEAWTKSGTGEGRNEDDLDPRVLREGQTNCDQFSISGCMTSQEGFVTQGPPDSGMQIDLHRDLGSSTSPTCERGHDVTWKRPIFAGNEPRRDSKYASLAGGLSYGFDPENSAVQNERPHLCDTRVLDIRTGIPTAGSTWSGDLNCSDRPYTSMLGAAVQDVYGLSPKLSVISDAGEQQQLRQQRTSTYLSGHELPHTGFETLNYSISSHSPQYILQDNIYRALVSARSDDFVVTEDQYLPNGQLCRIINFESVVQELSQYLSDTHTAEQIERFANLVCGEQEVIRKDTKKLKSFRKVFALLVLAEMSSSISLFLEDDVSDLDLPLVPKKNREFIELRRRDRSGQPCTSPLRCFQHSKWSQTKLRHFERDQWIMLAPFFAQDENSDVKHYELRDQHILPFVASEGVGAEQVDCRGGFGKVTMVRIHKEHHNFQDQTSADRGFAIKQLIEDDLDSFKKEVYVLKKFSGDRVHKHVVSLLATYEHRKKYHFIFHRADGDLFRFWKDIKSSPLLDYQNILWLAEQCAGIVDGLSKLHRHLTITLPRPNIAEKFPANRDSNGKHVRILDPIRHVRTDSMQSNGVLVRPLSPISISSSHTSHLKALRFNDNKQTPEAHQTTRYGRHGDINPGNILWYSDGVCERQALSGTLKLADFGEAELNSRQSRTRMRSVANTLTYRPPECDIQPRAIRQSYDIWCLACVYLELITWVLGGQDLLETFTESRKAPDIFHDNDPTDTFFDFVRDTNTYVPEVRVKPAIAKFINELHSYQNCTDYLHDVLMLVQHDMLMVNAEDRHTCEQVRTKLDDLRKKCRNDAQYASQARPWRADDRLSVELCYRSTKVEMTEEAEQKIERLLPWSQEHVQLRHY